MKIALLGLAMMGTATYGSADLFHKAQDVTGGVTAVYGAAASVDHYAETQARLEQQQKLYEVAAHLEPFADQYGRPDNADDVDAQLRAASLQTPALLEKIDVRGLPQY